MAWKTRFGESVMEAERSGRLAIGIGPVSVHVLRIQTVTYSEARENLEAMIDKVVADRAPLLITRQRGDGAVLISESEWASIEETLYLLRSPKNAQHALSWR